MKVIQYNQENVTKEEIDKVVRKSRGIILNKDGKALCIKYAGLYTFPGGSIEEENPLETLHREVLEETGIEQVKFEQEPFLKIESYDRNYYDRKQKKNINRLTETYFYYGNTQDEIHQERQVLTQSEKEEEFTASFQNLSVLQYLAENNQTDNKKKEIFNRELFTTMREFASYQKEKTEEREK